MLVTEVACHKSRLFIGGVYHAAILPIVLLEMERFGMSFLGAVDMVALIMVAAGINLANIIFPRDKGEAAIATPGFLINMGFGKIGRASCREREWMVGGDGV